MHPNTIPEIQRTNLATTVLTLKAMGINDLINFDFMDPPPLQTLLSALEELYALGALDEEGLLTRTGRRMANFPLEPQMSRTLITAVELGCADEMITIIAMLSVPNLFYRPKEKAAQADQKKAQFQQPEGDHLVMLAVYQAWKRNRFSMPWASENFLQGRGLKNAQDIRKQIIGIMDRFKLPVDSCGRNYNLIRRALCSGFFRNAAKKDPTGGYRTMVENQPVYIYPGSAIFQKNPEWVIYHELVLTTKEYMRNATQIEPKWLLEYAPEFYRQSDPNKISAAKRAQTIEPLFDKNKDPNEWRISRRGRK
jgi:ATP-dependent RNA helicase DHX8/PRP22